MMSDKSCPRCNLINPETALKCDCGYDFVRKIVDTNDPGFQRQIIINGLAKRKIITGLSLLLVGVLVTWFTYAIAKHSGFYIVAWGAIISGFIKMAKGLAKE